MRTRTTILAFALSAGLAGVPASAHKNKGLEEHSASVSEAFQQVARGRAQAVADGWEIRQEGSSIVAERTRQPVAGRAPGSADLKALRLASRAAVVNNAILDAERVRLAVVDREVILAGKVTDQETAARTVAALTAIPHLDKVQSRLTFPKAR